MSVCWGLSTSGGKRRKKKKKKANKKKRKKKSSAKKAQAKKHSQGVCTSAACLRRAVSSIFNLQEEPLLSPPSSHHCRLPRCSHLPGRDVHPDPRAKQQLFLSWAMCRQHSAHPAQSHTLQSSWQLLGRRILLFSFCFFSLPRWCCIYSNGWDEDSYPGRHQEHHGVAPTPQWVQDTSQVTPTHLTTLLCCSLAAGDPQMPQGYCWFHLLGGTSLSQAKGPEIYNIEYDVSLGGIKVHLDIQSQVFSLSFSFQLCFPSLP